MVKGAVQHMDRIYQERVEDLIEAARKYVWAHEAGVERGEFLRLRDALAAYEELAR